MSETIVRLPVEGGARRGEAHDGLLARAVALIPVLRERAAPTEALRRLPEETERDLHAASLFRVLQPRRVGGAELDLPALVDIAEAVAKGDASVAWTLANLASHHWMLGMFPKFAQETVWGGDPDALIASSLVFPAGKARRANGGYSLSGRWPFSSGVDGSAWNMLAGVVQAEDETDAPEYRIFLVPEADYEIIDTWHSSGLCGTGSKDVAVSGAFVAEGMSVAVNDLKGGLTPGSVLNPGPLYRLPVFALLPYVVAGVALGNAQAARDDYLAGVRSRASKHGGARLSDLQSTQIKIAVAGAKIDGARTVMRAVCQEAMAEARKRRVPDMAVKARYRRDGAFSVSLCTEAVDLLYAASGAGGLSKMRHLERQFRDAHAINAHIALNLDLAGATYGRVALGLDPDDPTL
jgi:3-hydroxy-9,10-secoandrosta-1,3,5(10)-triene-9,17-dione monooxygenase